MYIAANVLPCLHITAAMRRYVSGNNFGRGSINRVARKHAPGHCIIYRLTLVLARARAYTRTPGLTRSYTSENSYGSTDERNVTLLIP